MKEYLYPKDLPISPFLFDVWRCPECGYVITVEQYRNSANLNYPCPCCQQKNLSEFCLWSGCAASN